MGPSLLTAASLIVAVRTAKWPAVIHKTTNHRELELEIDFAVYLAGSVINAPVKHHPACSRRPGCLGISQMTRMYPPRRGSLLAICGRYYRLEDKQALAEHFPRAALDEGEFAYVAAYHIAPSTTQPVIRQSREADAREIIPMRWRLVGYNSASPDPKRSTFNARSETVERSPLWRGPFQRRRCLVPLSGFYEWKNRSAPLSLFHHGTSLFALAGLWDGWYNPADDTWLQRFAMLTTEANELMAPVHDRMPVILRPEDYGRWLSRDPAQRPPLDLLRPFDPLRMEMAPAHPKVGNVRNQEADMLMLNSSETHSPKQS